MILKNAVLASFGEFDLYTNDSLIPVLNSDGGILETFKVYYPHATKEFTYFLKKCLEYVFRIYERLKGLPMGST